jgi:cytochrome oxidase Cu insertion factor (SCO1/SenC/PrrC family)
LNDGPSSHRLQAIRATLMLAAIAFLAWHVLTNGRPTEPQGVERGPAGLASSNGSEERAAGEGVQPADAALTSIAGTFTDQDGHPRVLAGFRGAPFVASAIYTRCPTVCPRTLAALQRLERSLPVGDVPRFVVFSLDPAYDTPRVLRAFMGAHALSAPRWTLLRPDTASLPAVVRALGLAYSAEAGGGIAHTAVIAIVDSSGHVSERQLGLDQDAGALLAAWRRIWMTQRRPAD